jgi:hypothetical protein
VLRIIPTSDIALQPHDSGSCFFDSMTKAVGIFNVLIMLFKF